MKYSTHYTYDDRGALTSTSKDCTKGFVDDTAEVSYEYENDSLKHINHNGFQYTFEEDGFGNSTNIFVGNKRLIHQEYEGNNGNLSSEQYANGYTYLYKYDRMDRVTQINMKDPAGNEYVLYRYEYDKDGNLATEYDIREDIGRETIVTRYFYDMSGRMVYLRNDRDEDYRYVYDLNDNLVKAMQGNGYRFLQSEYGYDKDNREITSKTANKTYTTTYDALGRVASKAWNTANGFVTQYTYQDGANGSKTSQISKISNKGKDISYKYDKNGNITEISSEEGKITYLYDELGQLVREDNGVLNQTIGYVYDLGGNLYRKKIYDYLPGKDLYFPTEVQPKSEITYAYDNQWKDQLISYNGTAITYDASGNPLQYRGMTFGWKNENELSSVTKGDTSVTYRYNKDGVRNRKYLADGTIVYQLQGNAV
ncbi:MAG: RHS repeat protein, partial [Clostridia bacterium]|nr:RHS repeat protein [Clostridia bacterium]